MSKKIVLGLFAAFAVGMLILVIYGRVTHEEPVFMQVCWTDDKVTWVEDGLEEENRGSCDSPEELVWPKSQLPLTVTAFPPEGAKWNQAMDDALKAAIDHINGQLGYAHFRLGSSQENDSDLGSHEDIEVVFGAPYERGTGTTRADRAAASCSIQRADNGDDILSSGVGDKQRRLYSLVRLRDVGDRHLTHRILVHELGHCGLGLAHDPFKASIMYPFQAGDEGEHMEFIRFTDADREALQARYAP